MFQTPTPWLSCIFSFLCFTPPFLSYSCVFHSCVPNRGEGRWLRGRGERVEEVMQGERRPEVDRGAQGRDRRGLCVK
jgi:hypothetical protein